MWRNVASTGLSVFVLVLFGAAGAVMWGQKQYSAEGPLAEAMCLRVPAGGSMNGVSSDLETAGAVTSGYLFRVGADYSEKSGDLKAGAFLVPAKSSMSEIVDIVTGGGRSTCGSEVVYRVGVLRAEVRLRALDPATSRFTTTASYAPTEEAPAAFAVAEDEGNLRYRVALAEGATSWQVVDALKSAAFLTGDAEVPAEGSLAPDSYEVRKGDTVQSVLDRMMERQTAILDDAWENRAEDLPLASKEEALILASIVEKETGVAAERRQVASVFTNRLNLGMKLQTDPTVIYGVTKGQGALGRGLRQSELRGETEWNTYVIPGLPPTPIANPGKAAIEAALNPDTTPYIFFVADGTGGHAFAETLQQHNANVAEWRKIEAERAN